MRNYISIAVMMLTVLFAGCNKGELQEPELIQPVVSSTSVTNSEDIRIGPDGSPMEKSSDAVLDEIDPDTYAIHFKDYYYDSFYLNLKTETDGIYLYRGIWTTSSGVYDCVVTYDSSNKTLALNGYYRDQRVMMYHLKWVSNNYFSGRYCWLYAGENVYNVLYRMHITIKKGEFPGSNATE